MHSFIDTHCHCLPGLDDGPATMAEALALCNRLAEDGMTTVVATPHQLGRFDGRNEAAAVREAVCKLNGNLQEAGINLTILPGADVRIDERISALLKADRILTLADSRKYILLELPHEIFIDIESLLRQLAELNVTVIISHPERHGAIVTNLSLITKWLDISACLQITAASILGHFGPQAEKAAWHFLALQQVSLIATDAHDAMSRPPMMRAAFEEIGRRLGPDVGHLLCVQNPSRVIEGRGLLPMSLSMHKGHA